MTTHADLVVHGGTVVTDSWSGEATVVISEGRVTALLRPEDSLPEAPRHIDAAGSLVLPGGVDPHCHVAVPLGEFVTLDDFSSASLAALAGGTTTIIDFAIPTVGQDPLAALKEKLHLAASGSRCDYAFHGCIAAPHPDVAGVVRSFVSAGVRTIKLFTTYRGLLMVGEDTIEQVMTALSSVGGLTYVHAEADELVGAAQESAAAAGRIGAADMPRTRPELAEERAVDQVLQAAARVRAPVYFVHQTTPTAVDLVQAARRAGTSAYTESCPHYLTLDEGAYATATPERYVCCPPLRGRATVDALGERLRMGFVHTVGSDHCCYDSGQKQLRANDVRAMPNGLPGVETRVPVMWDAFVGAGLLSPEAFVAVTAANPARLNGLYPRKGTIAPGSDADLVLLDPNQRRPVRSADLHMQTDFTPYEGREVTGWPITVVARGRVVLDRGELLDPGPSGQFVPADPVVLP